MRRSGRASRRGGHGPAPGLEGGQLPSRRVRTSATRNPRASRPPPRAQGGRRVRRRPGRETRGLREPFAHRTASAAGRVIGMLRAEALLPEVSRADPGDAGRARPARPGPAFGGKYAAEPPVRSIRWCGRRSGPVPARPAASMEPPRHVRRASFPFPDTSPESAVKTRSWSLAAVLALTALLLLRRGVRRAGRAPVLPRRVGALLEQGGLRRRLLGVDRAQRLPRHAAPPPRPRRLVRGEHPGPAS
ncbi:hypothetical protein SALBM217S_08254 [Streptomyces griseoloalbus]